MGENQSFAESVRRIRSAAGAYREAQIYITFAELELGAALAERPLRLAALAEKAGADPRALGRYIDAAIAFALIERTGDDLLDLTPLARAVFTPGGEHSIANSLKLEAAFYERWGRLAQAVRIGGRPPENRAQEDDPGWVRRFTRALFDNARQTAPTIARAIDQVLRSQCGDPIRLVDVGGGHGAYSLAIARLRPDLQATVFDLPPVINVTREIVAESDVGDRVTTIAGDFHTDPLGTDYDVALLFGVLHGETSENAPKLLSALYDALRPGGKLLIRAHGRAASEPEQGEREMFDLHMLLSTEGGEVRRSMDTTQLVEASGFHAMEPIEIPAPGSGSLLVFRRET